MARLAIGKTVARESQYSEVAGEPALHFSNKTGAFVFATLHTI